MKNFRITLPWNRRKVTVTYLFTLRVYNLRKLTVTWDVTYAKSLKHGNNLCFHVTLVHNVFLKMGYIWYIMNIRGFKIYKTTEIWCLMLILYLTNVHAFRIRRLTETYNKTCLFCGTYVCSKAASSLLSLICFRRSCVNSKLCPSFLSYLKNFLKIS